MLNRPRPPKWQDRYGLALLLIVGTIVTIPMADLGPWGRVLSVAMAGCTLLFILYTSHAHTLTMIVAAAAVAAGFVTATGAVVYGSDDVAAGTPSFVGALLAVVAPIALASHLARTTAITRQTVAGALCIYLLVGVFFSFVYTVVGQIDPPFFADNSTDNAVDYVYFSFVTLTTTGYGDFTARTGAGRMLAVSEALTGQLYLVSIVAVLVANIGAHRKPPARVSKPEGDEPPLAPPE